jgi:signal transduction histidine kinase
MRRTTVVDAGASALAVAFLVVATAHLDVARGDRALDALGYVLLAVAGGTLAAARRQPWFAVGVVTVVLMTYIGREYPGGPIFVTAWISLFSLGYHARRRSAFVGAAALSASLILASIVAGRTEPLIHLVFVGWSAASVFLGDAVCSRRDSRVEESRRHLAEERLRIAQDLHDSVAHAMATINVQAGAAAHVMDRRPDAVKDALTAIQRASGDVLDELAVMLNVLREPAAVAAHGPTPGLDRVAALVDSTREVGLDIVLRVDGPTDVVPQPVGTAAFRIVQESLTNVVRHAGATTAVVTVHVTMDGALDLDVVDDGRRSGPSTGRAGRGVQGMHERATATGGHIEVGPRSGGGFRVHATWPSRS